MSQSARLSQPPPWVRVWERGAPEAQHITREPTAVIAPVLRLAPSRLAANLSSPQVLSDDGTVRMNCFTLKIRHTSQLSTGTRRHASRLFSVCLRRKRMMRWWGGTEMENSVKEITNQIVFRYFFKIWFSVMLYWYKLSLKFIHL